jgi:hypothetical protein
MTKKKTPAKVPFPDPAPTYDICIKAQLTADFDAYSNGHIQMTMDCGDVNDGNGKKVGSVAHAVPNGVSVVIGPRHYVVNYIDIWKAVYNATGEKCITLKPSKM